MFGRCQKARARVAFNGVRWKEIESKTILFCCCAANAKARVHYTGFGEARDARDLVAVRRELRSIHSNQHTRIRERMLGRMHVQQTAIIAFFGARKVYASVEVRR